MSKFQGELITLIFGIFLFCLSIYWVVSGTIWKPRTVYLTKKADSPMDYWFGVVCYFVAALMLIIYPVCRLANVIR